ncbi:hypothetical protein DPMN_066491 [Dreissena polymorpha]|uniref:Uncharacterized protein n=1 Tax=Dreissena polymorpha TaxID=45954 RepID=A0A9D3YXZ0_DREPO|nr:hypothetical protein DPMN_066491 [Dreissena polymorpha]
MEKGNTMTTRSTDSQDKQHPYTRKKSMRRFVIFRKVEWKCTEQKRATQCLLDLRTARNQDKQHPYTRKKSMRRKGYFKYQENKTSSQKAME